MEKEQALAGYARGATAAQTLNKIGGSSLSDAISGFDAPIGRMMALNERLSNLADKLCGPRPPREAVPEARTGPEPQAHVHRLHNKRDLMQTILSGCELEIERLSASIME